MKDTLHYIITSIVDNPDAVSIHEEEVDGVINFIVTVAQEDMGKVIGKEGKVIRSIRNIIKMMAIKHNVRINISLADTTTSQSAQ
jgi:uncharacterized protein